MLSNDITVAICKRRSICKYNKDIISEDYINIILEAGRWAPSGLNNQPWSFAIVQDTE
jgi:nitroreductase